MIPFIQSNLKPGNCWQTAVASILGIDPECLPDQSAIAAKGGDHSYYNNPLQAYLFKHHGLMFCTIQDYMFGAIKVTSFNGYHTMSGPTVRTATNGGIRHCVVGHNGLFVHDPHPSQAGLLKVESWGFLAPLSEEWKAGAWQTKHRCQCPECGGVHD